MPSPAEHLQEIITAAELQLRGIPEQSAADRQGGGAGWSRKQELGHLIDSATNNRVRFVKAALEGKYDGPSYDAAGWVELAGYAAMGWASLIDQWKSLNLSLAVLLGRIPPERLSAACRVGGAESVSLEFLIEDYMRHMEHHLDHIFGRVSRAASETSR